MNEHMACFICIKTHSTDLHSSYQNSNSWHFMGTQSILFPRHIRGFVTIPLNRIFVFCKRDCSILYFPGNLHGTGTDLNCIDDSVAEIHSSAMFVSFWTMTVRAILWRFWVHNTSGLKHPKNVPLNEIVLIYELCILGIRKYKAAN